MRKAELIMAIVLGVFSAYMMWKSAELPIGWIPEEGPGGGAFPFWLSAGMLVCCIWIAVRWFRRTTAVSRSEEPYMDPAAIYLFAMVAGSITVMVGLIHFIGVYLAVPLFLLFYMRMLGNHSWVSTGSISVAAPVVAFFFFEIALRITLPKGYTEPLFYPLYDMFL
jgi:hypothetical protein